MIDWLFTVLDPRIHYYPSIVLNAKRMSNWLYVLLHRSSPQWMMRHSQSIVSCWPVSMVDPIGWGVSSCALSVCVGGYDRRVSENVEYLEELDTLARTQFGLRTFILYPNALETPPADAHVVFLCSFNDSQRTYLLRHSTLMLYTPTNEHFGITPVEGMYTELPVIATNTGGPLETVKHEETGLLLESDPKVWGQGIKDIISGRYDAKAMGKQGRRHVQAMFSLPAFADQMQHVLDEMIKIAPTTPTSLIVLLPMTIAILVVALLFTFY